jgi:hypothetical protein
VSLPVSREFRRVFLILLFFFLLLAPFRDSRVNQQPDHDFDYCDHLTLPAEDPFSPPCNSRAYLYERPEMSWLGYSPLALRCGLCGLPQVTFRCLVGRVTERVSARTDLSGKRVNQELARDLLLSVLHLFT